MPMSKILLVDDSSMDIKIVIDVIKTCLGVGVTINAFTNSLKAKSFYLANNVDLIITDLEMPEVDGFDLIDCVKAHGKETIIAVSGCNDENNDNRTILHAANLHGADYTISKATLYDDLSALLTTIDVKKAV